MKSVQVVGCMGGIITPINLFLPFSSLKVTNLAHTRIDKVVGFFYIIYIKQFQSIVPTIDLCFFFFVHMLLFDNLACHIQV